MDAVIAYVNGCEKVWRTEYNKYGTMNNFTLFRFYDWGTLRYVLRGISTYMPYIKNVFLLVSNIEQVPDYVDQSKVKIVLHKDYIPEEYLPTFNACTVELFIHNIKELDNEFIFFNDDMITVSPIAYNDLMYNGLPCLSFTENHSTFGKSAYHIIYNSFDAACLYVGNKNSYSSKIIDNPFEYSGPGVCTVHGPCVFLKHRNEEIYNSLEDLITRTISAIRYPKNTAKYIYSDVLYLENNYIGSRLTLTYIDSRDLRKNNCKSIFTNINTNYVCINDLGPICGLTYKESANLIQESLDIKLPKPSKYEISNK